LGFSQLPTSTTQHRLLTIIPLLSCRYATLLVLLRGHTGAVARTLSTGKFHSITLRSLSRSIVASHNGTSLIASNNGTSLITRVGSRVDACHCV